MVDANVDQFRDVKMINGLSQEDRDLRCFPVPKIFCDRLDVNGHNNDNTNNNTRSSIIERNLTVMRTVDKMIESRKKFSKIRFADKLSRKYWKRVNSSDKMSEISEQSTTTSTDSIDQVGRFSVSKK